MAEDFRERLAERLRNSPTNRAAVERLRALLATVPIRIDASGRSRLDFDAYLRGERR